MTSARARRQDAVMIAAAWFSLRGARSIFRPLERMAQTMQRVESGALDARVGPLDRRDEIGQLAGHLDHLLDTIDEKTRALQRWNAELDAKVAARTRDLEAAQQQLVRSEKLAAIGQLTASIAHEVNNPIAVIQGNLDLVRELGDRLMAAGAPEDDYLSALEIERTRRHQRRQNAQRDVRNLLEELERGARGGGEPRGDVPPKA